MKETFEICSALALSVSVFKIIILSFSGRLAKTFQFIIDVSILFILVSPVIGMKPYMIDVYTVEEVNYEAVENASLSKIVSSAEKLLERQISGEIEREFSKTPVACKAQIDPESYELISLKLYFERKDILLSSYEIKEFIKDRYSVKSEVMFE